MSSVPSGLVLGTAAGVPYVALPPTAVDAEVTEPAGLIVALHGLEPPRSAAAFAAAVPMTGVPVWRVYPGLPLCGSRAPEGESGESHGDYLTELYAPVVEHAAAELPDVVAEVREDLGLADTPIGLAGFSAGGAAALLALAGGGLDVRACALIAPTVSPVRLMAGLEELGGDPYPWTDASRELAERLDLTARATEIVARNPAFMLVAGVSDRLVTSAEVAGLRDLLRAKGATTVEAATFKMAHALAAEPGTDPVPPIAEAVSVDAALTSWFRDRFHVQPRETGAARPEPAAVPERPRRKPLFDLSPAASST